MLTGTSDSRLRRQASIRCSTCTTTSVSSASFAGLRRKAASARIDELVETLFLTKLTRRRVQELSGGEARRLHIAIALVHQPQLLLLDEPSVGADVATRRRLLGLVRELAGLGSGVLYSTHYLGEVEELHGSVVILHAGSVVAKGDTHQIVGTEDAVVLELVFLGLAVSLDASVLADAVWRDVFG